MDDNDLRGIRLPRQAAPRFCTDCGHQVPEGSRFCVDCGRFLATAPATSEEPTTVIPVATPTPMFVPAPESAPVYAVPPPPRRTPRDVLASLRHSRWTIPLAIGLAVLIVAGVGGVLLVGHLRNRPVVQALEASQASLAGTLDRLEGAQDLEQVRVAGRAFSQSLPTLTAQEQTLAGSTTELGVAGHEVVAAQLAIATAVAKIADAEPDGFAWWGPLHDDLGKAEADLASGTKALAAVDGDAAKELTGTADGVRHLEEVVGSAVADSARSDLTSLVDSLAAAPRTSAIRDVAEEAALQGEAVQVSSAALDADSTQGKALASYAAAYQGLEALTVLDADHLASWAGLRAPLATALSTAAGSDGAMSGRAALTNVDTVVRRGEDALKAWKGRYDNAVSAKRDDLRRLKDYRFKMDGQLKTYSSLRGELSNWIDRVEDPTNFVSYEEGYRVLSQASSDRYTVRDTMNRLDKPGEVVEAHQALLAVIGSGITAVDAAYSGLADAEYCETVCYYKDSADWQTFRSESARITAAYAAAVSAWQGRMSSIESSISNRQLPEKPEV